jgi:hypothetical protein
MSQLLLQVIIMVAFGAFCFGCGYLTAFVVTRNRWRDEMIKRGVARYNWQTGKWEWGEPLNARPPLPAAFVEIEEQLAFFLPPDADSDCRQRGRGTGVLHLGAISLRRDVSVR